MEDGVVFARNHERCIKYPSTSAIEHDYPNVNTVLSTSVETDEEIVDDIFKVKVDDKTYCLKSVHRNSYESNFQREIRTLRHCYRPSIISLISLLTDPGGKVKA